MPLEFSAQAENPIFLNLAGISSISAMLIAYRYITSVIPLPNSPSRASIGGLHHYIIYPGPGG